MKVAPSSEIDLNALVLALLAKTGPVTMNSFEFLNPQVEGKPVAGFRVDVKEGPTLTFIPMLLEDMVGAIQEQMLADSPTTTRN